MIGSLTAAFSYDVPLITFVGPLNSATTGGKTITVWRELFFLFFLSSLELSDTKVYEL